MTIQIVISSPFLDKHGCIMFRKGLFLLSVFFLASSSGQKNRGQKWALIVAGSNGWSNYRHQSDACHAWQILQRRLPKENIIVMIYDDIAYNPKNPTPGQIFNLPDGQNVYKGIVKDYTHDDVTPENFLNILKGDKYAMQGIGSGKVIDSGPDDDIFVYYTNHGGPYLVGFPNAKRLHEEDLVNALKFMAQNNKFNKLVFYMEACYSATMFVNLPTNLKIFATTAAGLDESSHAIYCGHEDYPCLADQYSFNWINQIKYMNSQTTTLEQQYEYVKNATTLSHVKKYGNTSMGSMTSDNFFGDGKIVSNERLTGETEIIPVPSHETPFHYLYIQLKRKEKNSYEEFSAALDLHRAIERLARVKVVTENIIRQLSPSEAHESEILNNNYKLTEQSKSCYKTVLDTYHHSSCFSASESDHAFKHFQKFVNLCSVSWTTTEQIVESIKSVCKDPTYHDGHKFMEEEPCWMEERLCHMMCYARGKMSSMELKGECVNDVCKCL